MAENKKSFLMYCDLIHTFEELTDEEAGRLIKHTLRYVNDLNPEAPDRLTKISFEPIKQALKRDLVKYEAIREKKRLAGLASAESRKQNQHVSTYVDSVQHKPTHSTVNDSVSDSDSVSDIVLKKDKEKTWRNDFSIYLSELNSAIKELLSDNEWKMLREKFLPNVDIKLSLEKAYRDFWGTEAGWHHKKKSKSQTLDWKRTLNTAIELNKVYKQR